MKTKKRNQATPKPARKKNPNPRQKRLLSMVGRKALNQHGMAIGKRAADAPIFNVSAYHAETFHRNVGAICNGNGKPTIGFHGLGAAW